jgi:hypothetical protein
VVITPVTIRTTASFEQLRVAANQLKPWTDPGGFGWGGVFDDPDPVGRTGNVAVTAGPAQVVEEAAFTPEHFRARVYWREVDKKVREALQQTSGPEILRLQAADVLITTTSVTGEYLCLLSLRNIKQINGYVVPALQELLATVDTSAIIDITDSALNLTNSDFFRWLLYRGLHDPELTKHLEVGIVRDISGQDFRARPTSVTRGADLDRPELLALIMADQVQFGPIKLAVYDSELQLDVEFELRDDGGFSVIMLRSEYDEDPPRDEKGLRIVTDLAFKVVPEIRGAWNADTEWVSTNRDAFIEAAIEQMEAALKKLKASRRR